MKTHSAYIPVPLLLAALILLSASSCSDRSGRVSAALSAADSLMMTDPRAALDTLLTIDSSKISIFKKREQSYYSLLMTEARYKCWLPVDCDTAIFESAAYYGLHGPDDKLARAVMMVGAVHTERSESVLALESYKEAEPIMKTLDDREQLGLLHTKMGALYQLTFNDVSSAVYRYRQALLCFEHVEAERRLARACLTLSRVLLSDKDSVEIWKTYYRRGLDYAEIYRDSVCFVEALNQYVYYLYFIEKDYSESIRISKYALKTYSKYCSFNYYCDFLSLSSASYARLGNLDSAKILVEKFPHGNPVSEMMWHKVKAVLAECSQDWESAYMHSKISQSKRDSINNIGNAVNLQERERYLDIRYQNLLQQYEKRGYQVVILIVVSILTVLCSMAVVMLARYRHLRLGVRRVLDSARQKHGVELNDVNDTENLEILSKHLDKLAGRDSTFEKSAETMQIIKKQIVFIDSILDNYYTYCNGDKFRACVEDVIEANFPKKGIKKDMIKIAEVLYPGFLEHLRDKYGLSETDSYYISLLLCGFSNRTQQVLTRTKIESISVARSKVAAKTGKSTMLSKLILLELEDYASNLNADTG